MKRNGKWTAGIAAGVVILITGIIGIAYLLTGDDRKSFPADGYVLEVTSENNANYVAGITFSSGTRYRSKFPSSYIFKDIQGKKSAVAEESFIHYSDGSISAFADGMTVNMQEVGQGFIDFYNIKKGMVMTKAAEGWEIDNNQSAMPFPEILWQISGDKVLAASEELTLELPGREPEKISGYLEVTWPDQGIVQVANQELVCQTVAEGGRITYRSGVVLDLKQLAALGTGGEICFTLGELMADRGGGIVISSDSAKGWRPPEFRIHNEDGEDGRDGTAGESGEAGEAGEIGEAGDTGEDGEAGADGEQGSDGEEGREGQAGENGTMGLTGASGTGGGTMGGGGPDDDDGEEPPESRSLGSIRISDMQYDYESARMKLLVEDPDATLINGTGSIEVREALTDRQIWYQSGLDFKSWGSNSWYELTGLSPDKGYVLYVKNRYSFENEDGGDPVTGEKVYIKRDFYTNSEGFTLIRTQQDKTGISLGLEEFASSLAYDTAGPLYGMLCIRCGGLWETFPAAESFESDHPVGLAPALISDWKNNGTGRLDIAELMANRYGKSRSPEYESRKWTSDIPYSIELYTSTLSDDPGWGMLARTGQAGLGSGLKMSAQVLEGRTLKEMPVIGKVSVNDAGGGYYDFLASVEKDDDGTIRGYRFFVEGDNGDKKVIDSVSNSVKWYCSGDTGSLEYTVKCEVTCNDNEKDNILSAQPAKFVYAASALSSVVYTPADAGAGEQPNLGKIKGSVRLTISERQLSPQRLTLNVVNVTTPSGEEGYKYDRTLTYYLRDELGYGSFVDIPVECTGLRSGVEYRISVWGILKQEGLGDSDQISQTQRSICLGNCKVTVN